MSSMVTQYPSPSKVKLPRLHVIVNDPFGEMDVVRGTYINSKGAGLAYSKANWGPRWLVEGTRSGWCIIAEP